MVKVEDTGVGISEAELPTLFRKFGKLQRTAEINSDGIGLGLTIVRQIVETHDGEIHASSNGVDQGSKFTFDMKI